VAQLAQASGGTVRLENRVGGGLDAQVSFGEEWTPERVSGPVRRGLRSRARRAGGVGGRA
jgi:hypothetical protein